MSIVEEWTRRRGVLGRTDSACQLNTTDSGCYERSSGIHRGSASLGRAKTDINRKCYYCNKMIDGCLDESHCRIENYIVGAAPSQSSTVDYSMV